MAELLQNQNLNLLSNFPKYEVAIPFDTTERFLGSNLSRIMDVVRKMPDTFGLCGVIAMHTNGMLTNPTNWSDITYDPLELKKMFDKWQEKGEGISAWTWFNNSFKDRLTGGPNDFAVVSQSSLDLITPKLGDSDFVVSELRNIYDAIPFQQANTGRTTVLPVNDIEPLLVGKNDGNAIAVLCNYPKQNGTHTHWLSAKPTTTGDVLISGDLTPFSVDAFGIHVPKGDLLKAISQVIGSKPTTSLTNVLAQHEQSEIGRKLHNDKMFLSNFVRRAF